MNTAVNLSVKQAVELHGNVNANKGFVRNLNFGQGISEGLTLFQQLLSQSFINKMQDASQNVSQATKADTLGNLPWGNESPEQSMLSSNNDIELADCLTESLDTKENCETLPINESINIGAFSSAKIPETDKETDIRFLNNAMNKLETASKEAKSSQKNRETSEYSLSESTEKVICPDECHSEIKLKLLNIKDVGGFSSETITEALQTYDSPDLSMGAAYNNNLDNCQRVETTDRNNKIETYNQIGREIMTKLEQKGPMEFKLQLEPEDLGQIDIKLKLAEGKLVIDIMAVSSKTQSLLISQVDKLISSMGLLNVQVETVHIGHQTQQTVWQFQDGLSQGQSFLMNDAADFSRKKQHEHLQQQMNSKHFRSAVNDLKISACIPAEVSFYRMDYSV